MDYQVVTVRLNDGREFPRAVVTGGIISRVQGHPDIPFGEREIAELVVTNDVGWLRR
jgi:hypothetical protein